MTHFVRRRQHMWGGEARPLTEVGKGPQLTLRENNIYEIEANINNIEIVQHYIDHEPFCKNMEVAVQ